MSLAVVLVLILVSFCPLAFGHGVPGAGGSGPAGSTMVVMPAGPIGRITFTGAIVVGTLATPWMADAGRNAKSGSGEHGRLPPRVALQRPLPAGEVAPQLRLLERAGERFGSAQEMVVTYL